MFKATVDGKVYVFEFVHIRPEGTGKKGVAGAVNFETECHALNEDLSVMRVTQNLKGKAISIPVYAIAVCNPTDNFEKSTGRKISLARCLKLLSLTKEDRFQIWKSYFKAHPSEKINLGD